MIYERLIHEYLDEGLNEEMQQQLFNQLSVDESLRMEFNKQMKLHLLAKEDFETMAPPVELTNKVFQSAGFSVPFASIPGFKISYLFGILPILILLYSITNFDKNIYDFLKFESQIESKSLVLSRNDSSEDSNIKIASTLNISKNVSKTNKQGTYINNIKNNNNYNAVSGSNSGIDNNINNSSKNMSKSNSKSNKSTINLVYKKDNKDITYLHEKDMDYMGKPFHFISSSKIENSLISITKIKKSPVSVIKNSNVSFEEPIISLYSPIGTDNSLFAISARGINNSSLYKQIGDYNLPTTNYALSLAYKVNPQWFVIVEYSNENFLQEFRNTNSIGINYLTRQNPNLNIFSLGLRYNATEIFKSNLVFPFIQTNIGYADIGAVSRLITGIEYRISENLSLIPAFELSGLIYANQFGNYFSNNNGFSLGLTYNFLERN